MERFHQCLIERRLFYTLAGKTFQMKLITGNFYEKLSSRWSNQKICNFGFIATLMGLRNISLNKLSFAVTQQIV